MEQTLPASFSIFVLEDDAELGVLIKKTLARAGISVTVASDVHTAMATLLTLPPDLLILDYQLADMTGKDIVHALRQQGYNIPFIIITGHGDERIAVEMMKLGAQDYLIKDVNFLGMLPTVVARAIAHLQTEQALKQAQRALRISEERYRLLFENAPIAIGHYDTQGHILMFNQMALQDINQRLEDLVGKSVGEIFERATAEQILERMKIVVTSEKYLAFEDRVRLPTGERWFLSNYTRLTDASGNVIGMQIASNDITERKHAEEQIHASLREKELLLKEIHHRVKNNMQVISSLLALQSRAVKDTRDLELFQESQNRIRAMSMIHERLYNANNFSQVNFSDYIHSLTIELCQTYRVSPAHIQMRVDVSDNIALDITSAIPCGLVLNELLSNALKFAFPTPDQDGEITVSLHRADAHQLELMVRDNGVGLPAAIDLAHISSLGLDLVVNLTKRQLRGDIRVERTNGATFYITFPV